MIILTDIDGVLADFVGALCEELQARGFETTPEDVKHWDLAASLSSDEMRAALEVMTTPGFCHGLEWYEGARQFLAALGTLGEVHALTAPLRSASSWVPERLSWLARDLDGDRVHFVSGKHKHMMRGDVLIEDHPKNAIEWLDAHPRGIAILIDRPWNSPDAVEFWPHARMYRAKSYEGALQVLRECA